MTQPITAPPCTVHSVPCPCVAAMEAELKAEGWRPFAAHPNSEAWYAPDGQVYPGPGFAWQTMKQQKDVQP